MYTNILVGEIFAQDKSWPKQKETRLHNGIAMSKKGKGCNDRELVTFQHQLLAWWQHYRVTRDTTECVATRLNVILPKVEVTSLFRWILVFSSISCTSRLVPNILEPNKSHTLKTCIQIFHVKKTFTCKPQDSKFKKQKMNLRSNMASNWQPPFFGVQLWNFKTQKMRLY